MKSNEISKILNDCWDWLNKEMFNGELKPIIITFFSDKKNKRELGYFKRHNQWNKTQKEIVIMGLAWTGDWTDILKTLLHEMVHQYCEQNEIKDCANNGRHNKEFKKYAEKFGFENVKVEDKNIGYTTEKMNQTLIQKLDQSNLELNKLELLVNDFNWKTQAKQNKTATNIEPATEQGKQEPKKPKEPSIKYECESCGYKFKIKLDLNLKCNDCGQDLIKSM